MPNLSVGSQAQPEQPEQPEQFVGWKKKSKKMCLFSKICKNKTDLNTLDGGHVVVRGGCRKIGSLKKVCRGQNSKQFKKMP